MLRSWYKYLLLLSVSVQGKSSQDHCSYSQKKINQNSGSITQWANSMPTLKTRDQQTITDLEEVVNNLDSLDDDSVVEKFYKFISSPLQTQCKIGKWLAFHRFFPNCGSSDGEWYVCMDNIYQDVQRNKCLVYSFGISDDLTFEEEMAGIGCKVHAYDPTVRPVSQSVRIHNVGLAHYTGNMTLTINHDNNRKSDPLGVMTLADAISANEELESTISYLKVDVEASEIKAIPEWLESNVLKNVKQIGIEMHTGKVHLTGEERPQIFKELLKSFLEFYQLGFRLISYSPNLCVSQTQDQYGARYYTYADIVFYKP